MMFPVSFFFSIMDLITTAYGTGPSAGQQQDVPVFIGSIRQDAGQNPLFQFVLVLGCPSSDLIVDNKKKKKKKYNLRKLLFA